MMDRAPQPIADQPVRDRRVVARRWLLPPLAGLVVVFVVIWTMRLLTRSGWFGDLLAIGMPYLVATSVVAGVGAAVLHSRWGCAVFVGAALGATWTIVAPRWAEPSPPPTRTVAVVAANLRFDSDDPANGVRDVIARHPDVVVISELTSQTDRLLRAQYRYHVVTWGSTFGEGVYSTLPLTELTAPVGLGLQALRVGVAAQDPFVLYAVHLPKPQVQWDGSPNTTTLGEHRRLVDELDRAVRAEVAPTVVAGDLNLSDRTDGYRVVSDGRRDAGRTDGFADSTFGGGPFWSFLRLRIDYVLVSAAWCIGRSTTFAIAGSDHRGLDTAIGPCAD